jgi:hydrogenase maturation protein HypF
LSAPASASAARLVRARARVEGTVQGVGFRPYVYRLATALSLDGFVLNDSHGVEIEVQGAEDAVARFLRALPSQAPPLARIERVSTEPRPLEAPAGFEIRESPAGGAREAPVSPDTPTCGDCLAELSDPADRRFRYPFINCTNCGPRFTIARGIPYDRPLTTMAGFTMCERCRAEYEDPADRRFHAQPNACPDCGPTLRLLQGSDTPLAASTGAPDAVAAAAAALRAGAIVAVKGIGGFHLACRADDEAAVATLRARKHREDKPFALMTADLEAARELVQLGEGELALLASPARPIVLAQRLPAAPVAASVAPRSREFGVMLAYSPLHHLLLADAATALVMTSGNVSDEPIAYEDADALARLRTIADLFLVHDRPIETRTDDSVARVAAGRPMLLRRSRGHVPASIELTPAAPVPLLACGAELKSTFCLARGRRAWVSHHIGDLKNHETLSSFAEGIEHFERLFGTEPAIVVHDMHPDYLSTRYALEREGVQAIAVQHHHAHLAACLAEHGERGAAVAAIYDGSGFGCDGTVWGGELLVGGLRDFERAGHLRAVRLPGGDAAVLEPWRLACAWLLEAAEGETQPPLPRTLAGSVDAERWETIARLACSELAPACTSVGRLFDALAALCGLRSRITYEGQAAIELEGAIDPSERGAYAIEVAAPEGSLELDPRGAIRAALRELDAGTDLGAIAARFHAGLANATADACERLARARGLELVVLSGGVFQNRTLLALTLAALERAGLRALVPERLPPGDGGISFGQAAVAAARLSERQA